MYKASDWWSRQLVPRNHWNNISRRWSTAAQTRTRRWTTERTSTQQTAAARSGHDSELCRLSDMSVVGHVDCCLFVCLFVQKAQANNAQIRLTLEQARQQERQALYVICAKFIRYCTRLMCLHTVTSPCSHLYTHTFLCFTDRSIPVIAIARWLFSVLSVCVCVCQSVSGTLDRQRVVAPSKTCGHVRSSRRRWRWAQRRPRSAAPTFGRVVLACASTLAWLWTLAQALNRTLSQAWCRFR